MSRFPGYAKVALTVTAVAAAIVLYYKYDPAVVNFFPPCPSKLITGYDCPGCGTQRALHCFLHGDMAGVIHYNAMLVVGVPLVLTIFASNLLKRRYPKFHSLMNSNYVIALAAIMTFFWTVYRNL